MGEVFAGRFELLDPVATGGMGTVWRVLDRRDGELKAAKILRQSDAASLLRFVREQSVRVAHDHVVTPLSWAGVDDRVLFTMPLVRGGSVSDLVRTHGSLPPWWVARLLDQTLQALEAVHAAGIVHRDVKPGNLLLEPTGTGEPHLRLTDFGIAVPLDEPRMTRASMVIGTPGYMPPEQWRGADPHPSADVFAAGRVALEMLTGVRPDGETPVGTAAVDVHRTGDAGHDAVLDLVVAATAERAADRPIAGDLRALLASGGLLREPRSTTDSITVPDRYVDPPGSGAVPPPPPYSPPPSSYPPPPDPPSSTPRPGSTPDAPTLGPPPTRVETAGATRVERRPDAAVARPSAARWQGLLLLVLGLLGLVVAAVLLVG